jgi:hypothetical protein
MVKLISQKNDALNFLKLILQKQLENGLFERIERKGQKSKLIYHYTTLECLQLIVERQSFILSNSIYLNDKQEFYHGVKKIIDALDRIKRSSTLIPILRKKLESINHSNKYVTCFSSQKDLLSQWRAYAEDGKGVAIGIDRKTYIKGLDKGVRGFFVLYNESEQNEFALELIIIAWITLLNIYHFLRKWLSTLIIILWQIP